MLQYKVAKAQFLTNFSFEYLNKQYEKNDLIIGCIELTT